MDSEGQVLSWINATLSLEILESIFNSSSSTARETWLAVEKRFLDQASSRHLQLKLQLQTFKKGSQSMNVYLQKMKITSDALNAIGHPVPDTDLVLHILSGLTPDYESFITAVTTRPPLPPFEEIRPLLINQELRLQQINQSS